MFSYERGLRVMDCLAIAFNVIEMKTAFYSEITNPGPFFLISHNTMYCSDFPQLVNARLPNTRSGDLIYRCKLSEPAL
jgi:hypothetical protein